MKYQALITEFREYYGENGIRECIDQERIERMAVLKAEMERYAQENPHANAWELRGRIYQLAADHFQPKIFLNAPFYAEMGGNGGWTMDGIGRWLLHHHYHMFKDVSPTDWEIFQERARQKFYLCCGPYIDSLHDCPPFRNILKKGFRGVYEEAVTALKECRDIEETSFVQCAIEGLLAVKKILERYAEMAGSLSTGTLEPEQKKFMQMIAAHAPHCPWEPPQTFYEGLNALWFIREIYGELDGMATNSLGHPDAMLIELYEKDLSAGRISPAEAYDLICRFLLMGDCHYDKNSIVKGYIEHESEISLTLGGCNEKGNEIFNEITEMFLRAYRELELISPKPHCRFSANSAPAYLALITEDILGGRGVYSLLNDGAIVEALVKSGKTPEDAREYNCSGCWDIVVESRENLSTGNYFNMPRVLEASIYDEPENMSRAALSLEKLDGAEDFEDFYQRLLGNMLKVFRDMAQTEGKYGRLLSQAAPLPLYSAGLTECLTRRKDVSAGGGRYNPRAVSLAGFANIIDSLLAVKIICFDEQIYPLADFLAIVRRNWEGAEELHAKVLAGPHWGDLSPESICLGRRLHEDMYKNTRDLENERGGSFELGYWVYREFRSWGEQMKALPDGRRNGEILAQGLNPSHFRNHEDITTTFNGAASLDLSKCAANSVLNVVLENNGLTPALLDSLLRSFANLKLQLLQLNCLRREDLLDARKHPERYQSLVVRICGFSVKFVSLSPEWQDEFLARKNY